MNDEGKRSSLRDLISWQISAPLCQAVAIYIASQAPERRAAERHDVFVTIDQMVSDFIEEMIEDGQVPEAWRGDSTQ
jgi:hypothetical protein